MNPDWPMLSRPVKPKWTLSPMAAMATAAVCGDTASRSIAFQNCLDGVHVNPP